MKKSILTFVVCATFLSTFAQTTEVKNHENKFEFSLYGSFTDFSDQKTSLRQVAQRFPSTLFGGKTIFYSRDLPDFYTNKRNIILHNIDEFKLSVGAGRQVELFKSKKFENTWRVGIMYLKTNEKYVNGFNTTQESLTVGPDYSTYNPSSSSSSVVDNYFARINNQHLQLQTDFVFRFFPDERLSFYSGIGAGLGISFDNSITISKNTWRYNEVVFQQQSSDSASPPINSAIQFVTYDDYKPENTESFRIKSATSLFVYVPVGIDLSLGKSEFWAKHHLFYEGQLTLRFSDSYLGEKSTLFRLRHGLGYRFTL